MQLVLILDLMYEVSLFQMYHTMHKQRKLNEFLLNVTKLVIDRFFETAK